MAIPFSEPRRQSNFLHHTLNITVQPKHLEEALTCLVESILGIRSRGKLVSEYPKGFREKPKSSNLRNCVNFNFDYYSVQSKELGRRIGRQIRRFRWLSCVFKKASVAEFYLNFYQCETPPESTADYVSFIGHIFEVWQINISTVRFEEEDESRRQVEQMITTLKECIDYIHQHKFLSFFEVKEYLELYKLFDMSFIDISPCHYFVDTKFPTSA